MRMPKKSVTQRSLINAHRLRNEQFALNDAQQSQGNKGDDNTTEDVQGVYLASLRAAARSLRIFRRSRSLKPPATPWRRFTLNA